MTRQLMISQLRLGNNGAEILQILDAITGGENNDTMAVAEPTMDEIQF